MKSTPQQVKIGDMIARHKTGMIRADPEYQRGVVWTPKQMSMLVDSVLRGYSLPLFYFRHVKTPIPGTDSDVTHRFEVIDGQQRISALCGFHRGVIIDDLDAVNHQKQFPLLLDPTDDVNRHLFPLFIQDRPCPWAGKTWDTLPEEFREQFLEKTVLQTVQIDCDTSEARDLFIRLQGGNPLKDQEKRDALPGDFATFVLKYGGGKPSLGYVGHSFFPELMNMRPQKDKGNTRKLAAQMLMMHLEWGDKGSDAFVDFKESEIDAAYHRHVQLPHDSPAIVRFEKILDKLVQLLGDGRRPLLKKHNAVHLPLFIDSIMRGNYTSEWETHFAEAFDAFTAGIAGAPNITDLPGDADNDTKDFSHYKWRTSTQANKAPTMRERHGIFARQMTRLLNMHNALVSRDDQRVPHQLLKEEIYFLQKKTCQECGLTVRWDTAEFHHVIPYRSGGETQKENLALVHKDCHPKGCEAEKRFKEKWDMRI